MVGRVESTISLVIEIIALGLLMGALYLKTRKKYRQHGIIMLAAVILHLVAILAVMVPSFAAFTRPGLFGSKDALAIVTLVHVSAGLFTALLGVWLVGSWHLKADLKGCLRKRRVMDVTIILWVLTIVLGIFLYLAITGVI